MSPKQSPTLQNSIANSACKKTGFNLFCFAEHKKLIIADIGGNLSIESLQDTSTYNSKQESASASVTVGMSGGSGSVNASQSKINGNYASVKEQSGLKAGDGGFQVNVKGNTNLKGAVIESTQAATDSGSNSFTTGTLTTSDIHNVAEYDAQSVSVGASTSGVSLPAVMGADGKNESTTRSGISGAKIKITDEAKQKQLTGKDSTETVATLNKDVKTGKDTSGAIGNNLDVAEIQTGFTVTQTFTQQVGTLVANMATKSEKLKAAGEQKQKDADKETDLVRKQQLQAEADNLKQQSVATAEDSKQWQPGGTYRQIATALSAAVGGNVTAGTGQLIQSAAVNYLQSLGATEVKKIADSLKDPDGKPNATSESVRAALHGILACAGASAQGSSCGTAAMGASAGSVINSLMQGDPATMTAQEKENRKNLVTSLVAGIATAAGSSNIAAATNAATIETENNAVYISGHLAGGPAGNLTTPKSNHLSIVLVPDNPKDFTDRTGWKPTDNGGITATLGAQPTFPVVVLSDLVAKPNYADDAFSNGTFHQKVDTPLGQTDTQFISNLITAAKSYNNNYSYSIPNIISSPSGYMAPKNYNSNSFVSGVIKAAGGTPPQLDTNGNFQTPGYSNPIPLHFSAGVIRRTAP